MSFDRHQCRLPPNVFEFAALAADTFGRMPPELPTQVVVTPPCVGGLHAGQGHRVREGAGSTVLAVLMIMELLGREWEIRICSRFSAEGLSPFALGGFSRRYPPATTTAGVRWQSCATSTGSQWEITSSTMQRGEDLRRAARHNCLPTWGGHKTGHPCRSNPPSCLLYLWTSYSG